MSKLSFLLPLVSVLIVDCGELSSCPQVISNRIRECMQPIAQYAQKLDPMDAKNATRSDIQKALSLPNLGQAVFRHLCKLKRLFDQCVSDHRRKCPNYITINLIDASYSFLCGPGYNAFLRDADCLMELDQQSSVKVCHDESLKVVEHANNELVIAMEEKLEIMCYSLNSFAQCVRSPVRHNCGVSAWSVLFKVLKDMTNALLPKCSFTRHSNQHQKSIQIYISKMNRSEHNQLMDPMSGAFIQSSHGHMLTMQQPNYGEQAVPTCTERNEGFEQTSNVRERLKSDHGDILRNSHSTTSACWPFRTISLYIIIVSIICFYSL